MLWEKTDGKPVMYRIAVGGDYLPGNGLTPVGGRGWRDMARGISPHFRDAAASVVNLEGPVGVPDGGRPGALCAPPEALEYLEELGVGVVGIANNHIYDYGQEWVKKTMTAIARRGLVPLGSGRTLAEVPEVHVWRSPGRASVGFWAAANVNPVPSGLAAAGTEPATVEQATRAARELQAAGARFNVALLHTGLEQTNRPDPSDVALMEAISAAGFRLVAACHSHRISGAAVLHNGKKGEPSFCFYGLGSIASGVVYSPLEKEGLVAVVGLDEDGNAVRVEVRPVLLDEAGWGTVPHDETPVMNRFRSLSAELADGTYKKLFYQDVSPRLFQRHYADAVRAFRDAGIRGVMQKFSRLRVKHLLRAVHKVVS
jgi:poly-gamma-glutamate capsule biosynthesis protein CapA/YwtB (metallophosphatase superfamily)